MLDTGISRDSACLLSKRNGGGRSIYVYAFSRKNVATGHCDSLVKVGGMTQLLSPANTCRLGMQATIAQFLRSPIDKEPHYQMDEMGGSAVQECPS
jgi:hypothetical protein